MRSGSPQGVMLPRKGRKKTSTHVRQVQTALPVGSGCFLFIFLFFSHSSRCIVAWWFSLFLDDIAHCHCGFLARFCPGHIHSWAILYWLTIISTCLSGFNIHLSFVCGFTIFNVGVQMQFIIINQSIHRELRKGNENNYRSKVYRVRHGTIGSNEKNYRR